jgi:hypothetical protein
MAAPKTHEMTGSVARLLRGVEALIERPIAAAETRRS